MSNTSTTVTAVVLCHENKQQLLATLDSLKQQTKPIDQLVVVTCCIDASDIDADIKVQDIHRDDWGQHKCDIGLRSSTSDLTFFVSSDDGYDPEFVKIMSDNDADIVLGGFKSHLVGTISNSEPQVGRVTRGSFMVRTKKGIEVGYNHRTYDGDGQFVVDIVKSGGKWSGISDVLHFHN